MKKKTINQVEERKVRSDKKTRVSPSLDSDTHKKLKKLAISCDMTKTQLSGEILKMALNNESVIDWFQKKYNKDDSYRIILARINGVLHYS
ncbi:hypothetical protein NSQ76_20545 [Bacillus sp. FSL M8-0256]|uniref:hypothetical protein n=1 Tax=Bacillus TaxID=1386 RepID=UPI0013B78B54|nr:hypothetical protein [Bacillus subtilis]KAF2423370.1 hypothetical protein B6K89_16225 [Bacillus subtilis]MCY9145438.1 hypothetical protein [Bacillus sp. T9C1]MEC0312111.1 hypothetical protein [Bacillus subtilis]MEC0363674.1 hypothetical protein [Bacillus subtilis]